MAIEITDYLDVEQRASDLGLTAPEGACILPRRFASAKVAGEAPGQDTGPLRGGEAEVGGPLLHVEVVGDFYSHRRTPLSVSVVLLTPYSTGQFKSSVGQP